MYSIIIIYYYSLIVGGETKNFVVEPYKHAQAL